MTLKDNLILLIGKLVDVIERLPDEIYSMRQPLLFDGSIGQHCRHIYEFYEQLSSYDGQGILSYDERKRNPKLENSKNEILLTLKSVSYKLSEQSLPDRLLLSHNINKKKKLDIETTSDREYLFLIDHTIHHLAIIRIGIHHLLPDFEIPDEFGYTTSTLVARESSNT